MASNSRRQIETWLKTIEVNGSVIDIGGLFWPIKGRTKSWNVDQYEILDIKSRRGGARANWVFDLNREFYILDGKKFDNAFCIEVTDHFWNPIVAFRNIARLLRDEGLLYVSSNFLFPHHTGFDCIRFTRTGLEKVLIETGFEILEVTPRFSINSGLEKVLRGESKVVYHPNEIGYMIKAKKHG